MLPKHDFATENIRRINGLRGNAMTDAFRIAARCEMQLTPAARKCFRTLLMAVTPNGDTGHGWVVLNR